MDLTEVVLIAVMAVVWWIPTFIALAELQNREGVRRVLVWKWYGKLAIPVWGWIAYFRSGRAELDADHEEQRRQRPGVPQKRSGGQAQPGRGQRRRDRDDGGNARPSGGGSGRSSKTRARR